MVYGTSTGLVSLKLWMRLPLSGFLLLPIGFRVLNLFQTGYTNSRTQTEIVLVSRLDSSETPCDFRFQTVFLCRLIYPLDALVH
jgi:hypothetical protein